MKKILKSLRWTAVSLSLWTMLISPVAMGQEAKRISTQQLELALAELGLNKQMTIGQFYEKNKYLIPDRVKKEIEPLVEAGQNMMMPEFEVIANKGTAGEVIPNLRVSQNGELINIQWFGEKNRYIKFQNTNLSEVDIINFTDMFARIISGDQKFRKQAEGKPASTNRMLSKFQYPAITSAQWKTMSTYNKASYIVSLRTLWQDAKRVNEANIKKSKTTSSFIFDKYEYFFSWLLGLNAEAAGDRRVTANSCLIAGYVSEYVTKSDGKITCSAIVAEKKYAGNELYKLAAKACPGKLPCNPYVYGAKSSGEPICIEKSGEVIQTATHFGGACDSQAMLQSTNTEVAFLKDADPKKSKGRYNDDNLSVKPEDLKKIFEEDHKKHKELTENYILSILKLKNLNPENKTFKDLVLNEETRKTIMTVKTEFEVEINKAKEKCESVAKENNPRIEPNFWQACDQLHRRFLFIDQVMADKCGENGGQYNPDKMCCTCPVEPTPVTTTPVTTTPVTTTPVTTTPVTTTPVTTTPVTTTPVTTTPVTTTPVTTTPVTTTPVTTTPVTTTPVTTTPVTTTPVTGGGVTVAPQPNGSTTPVEVAPGVTCPNKPPVTTTNNGSKPICDDAVSDPNNCVCSNGKAPTLSDSDGSRDVYTCGGASTNGRDRHGKKDKDDDCGLLCKVGKGLKAVAPFAIAGVAAYFLFKMMAPKKPALLPAADKCPNGSIPPCAQVCMPPLKLQPTGACSCDGCPPGQTADPVTCTCSTGTPGGGTTILCPDSVTRAADLAACPDYPCWNGQKYKNPMNCPPAPVNPVTTPGVTQ